MCPLSAGCAYRISTVILWMVSSICTQCCIQYTESINDCSSALRIIIGAEKQHSICNCLMTAHRNELSPSSHAISP
ncbi:uncharacterized protein BDV14DRAFT_173420 [Aspergillus stella-maris]|uniref:uncharacterized protein n=1 Tax=Aspergillus stella-maris TaxID=1810926 RepID=UPI003CCD2D1E